MKRYADNHIVVADKPPGIATQPDFEAALRREGHPFLHAVHRLDKPASGLVLFARSSKALSRLQAMMREQQIERTYLAKVTPPLHGSGTLRHLLVHGDHKALVSPDGKEAILHYREQGGWLEVTLVTGRYHQIRAQLAAIGHPIDGDAKYGSLVPGRLQLHHARLKFAHPVTKEVLTFESFPSTLFPHESSH